MKFKLFSKAVLTALMLVFLSQFALAQGDSTDFVRFTNPLLESRMNLGQTFTYDYDATALEPDNIRFVCGIYNVYEKAEVPENEYSIDSLTGIFTFTPSVQGSYWINISAYLIPDREFITYTNTHLVVIDPALLVPCAKITGFLRKQTDSTPIANATVSIHRDSSDTQLEDYYYTTTLDNGWFSLDVPAGVYFLYARIENTDLEAYYADPMTGFEPLEFNTVCGDSIDVDFYYPDYYLPPDSANSIRFVTYPEYAYISYGQTYQFDVDAVDNDQRTIHYALMDYPQGATVDSVTGVVTWTPAPNTIYDNYAFLLKAYFESAPYQAAAISWSVEYGPDNDTITCTKFSGYVTDIETGLPVYPCRITAHLEQQGEFRYYGQTNTNGYYEVNVPAGVFTVYYESKKYYPSFFPNDSTGTIRDFTVVCGTEVTANMHMYRFPNEDPDTTYYIYFTNFPNFERISRGGYAFFNFDAETNVQGEDYRFELTRTHPGATINEYLGEFTWTPTADLPDGYYEFTVRTYSFSHPEVEQFATFSYYLGEYAEPESCAYVSGAFIDSLNNPVSNVSFWLIAMDDSTDYGRGKTYYYTTPVDANGHYFFNVPAGSYILYAQQTDDANYGYGLFYPGTPDMQQAQVITLTCSDTNRIVMVFNALPAPQMFTISGTVTDEVTGNPVQSVVMIYPINDRTLDRKKYSATMETSPDGSYSFSLPEGLEFKIAAVPMVPGYLTEYYNGANSWDNADVITISSDLSGVNFALARLQAYENGVSGIVKDQNGTPINAIVFAYRLFDNENDPDVEVYTDMTNRQNTGYFSFDNLQPDQYVLFAIPFEVGVVPGFYRENQLGTLIWEDATVLTVAQTSMITNLDYKLPSMDTTWGFGSLEGSLDNGSNRIGLASGVKSTTKSALNGAFLTILNSSNKIVSYCFADDKGNFELNKIGVGDYTLNATKIRFNSAHRQFKFDTRDNASQSTVITLIPKNTTDVPVNKTVAGNVFTYPNPANDRIKVNVSSVEGSAKLSIFNLFGEEVYSQDVTLTNGDNTIDVNVNSLSSGTYIVKINGKNAAGQYVFEVVK